MNLFISFDWDDRYQVNGFRAMLANPQIAPLSHRDTSVKYDYSEYGDSKVKDMILSKIRQSHLTVCLISQKTRNSDWVNWELERSRELGLPIVGIVLKEQPVATSKGVPEFFTRYPHYEWHQWNSPQALNAAIQRAYSAKFR